MGVFWKLEVWHSQSLSLATKLPLFDSLILSVMLISVVQMPIKTIPELFKPAFGVLPKTGDAEPEDPGKPG